MKLYRLNHSALGTFIERKNRFLGSVSLNGTEHLVHIHDPGRIPELRTGKRVLLKKTEGKGRKTHWDLLAFETRGGWCFSHSGYHLKIAERLIGSGLVFPDEEVLELVSEPRLEEERSRLDFFVRTESGEMFVEVKGVTWVKDGIALFPDAPTKRGLKHLLLLRDLRLKGFEATVVFLVFHPEARDFRAADEVDPAFSNALKEAEEAGVKVIPVLLAYDGNWISFRRLLRREQGRK